MAENVRPDIQASRKAFWAVGIIAAVAIVGWLVYRQNSFCFDFLHNTQFGDKSAVADYVNEGFMGPGGTLYYVPEVPALQTALEKEGFSIDEFEKTGGGVYLTSFFGPSTKSAVIEFQRRYDLAPTGEIDSNMTNILREKYGCTRPERTAETYR